VSKGGILIWELTEGNTFGEMEVLDVMPSAATVKAVTRVTVMSMSNKSLRAVYKSDIKSFALLLMNLARDLSRRLRMADEKITGKR
jgi:CRP-like cAMP-binding protein